MAGNTFGKIFRITTFGESHGKALGVIIDGCPAGMTLSEADIQPYMDRRKPGQSQLATQRREDDQVEILSGVFEGKTTGTPIMILMRNTDQRSRDYSELMDIYRPGHADFGFDMKYGFRDYRGGGRSSGRETSARVAAGAVAAKLLQELGVTVEAVCTEMAGVSVNGDGAAEEAVLARKGEQDSAGGIVECCVRGLRPGIGEPVFDKLDARLAQAVMSIGAVKAVEIGDGFRAAAARGSENNDVFYMEESVRLREEPEEVRRMVLEESVRKKSNHSGGVLGGMSDGDTLVLRAAFKPTPSIAAEQESINRFGEPTLLQIKGRHDPTVVQRAVVVVECMVALTVLDAMLENMTARLDAVRLFYQGGH